tara:strand:- start:1065 stop:2486 length:1422 start_codon:yes stop_codon:yes gene_type:complete
MNIVEHFLRHDKDRVAYISDDEEISYKTLFEKFRHYYNFLKSKNIRNDDHVMIVLEDSHHFPALVLACFAVGVKFYVPSPTFTVSNLQAMVAKTKTRHVFCNIKNDKVSKLQKVFVHEIEDIGVSPSFDLNMHQFTKDETAMYLNTTGSTGVPKLIPHSMENVIEYAKGWAKSLGVEKDDVLYACPKICFGHGFGVSLLVNLYVGCKAVLYRDPPTPQKIVKVFKEYGPQYLFMVPVIANMLVKKQRTLNLANLKKAVCASDFLPEIIQDKFKKMYNKQLLNLIGQSECFSFYTIASDNDYAKGSIGKPCENVEIKIIDQGKVCSVGEIGDLYVKTKYNANRYLNELDKTADTFRDGWVRTRDRATIGADGSIYYKGRVDNLIKIKSLFVSPIEIEDAFLNIKGIDDVLIETETDQNGIITLHAKIICDHEIDQLEIKKRLSEVLDAHKIPKTISKVAEIQRTWNGKKIRQVS